MKGKIYIWLPIVLFLYLCVMAYIGRDGFIDPATRTKHCLIFGGEILLLVVLFFVLRKRDRYRREREEDIKRANRDDDEN